MGRQRELNSIQFEGMEYLRNVWEMLRLRVHDGGKLSVVFEQGNAFSADAIDGRSGAKASVAKRQESRFDEPTDAPIEAVAGAFASAESHQLEQLNVTDELRIANLTQHGDVPFRLHHHAVSCVSHGFYLQPTTTLCSTRSSRACCETEEPVLSCQTPSVVRTQ